MAKTDAQLDNGYRIKRYEAFTKERDALRQYLLEAGKRSDSAVLALAGGGLALSVTFLQNIAPAPPLWTLPVLGSSWLLLITTLLLELYALAAAQASATRRIEFLDAAYHQYMDAKPVAGNTPDRQYVSDHQKFSERGPALTYCSRLTLSAGVFLLCAFTLLNLPYSRPSITFPREMSMKEHIQNWGGGFVLPPIAPMPPPPVYAGESSSRPQPDTEKTPDNTVTATPAEK